MKKSLIAMLALVLCLGMLIGCGGSKSASGEKASAKIILIDQDGTEYNYDVTFDDGASLRTVLFENKLISEEQFSAYFVENIDGHIADVMNDGCTWQPMDAKKNLLLGTFDEIAVKNGDTLYLQYYVVPNFDD